MSVYSGQGTCTDNRIYNNTFWYCGWSPTGGPPATKAWWDDYYSHAVLFNTESASLQNNHFKNNLFWQNRNLNGSTTPIIAGW